ncbi:MAG: MerR family transcriptional regulator [Oscillospiraceae bacterium]|nr:MerR family transcriptional regulator [Oscillospiraceae bacterium]
MSRENGLLSIGEISKLTGASLRSLRYYEKLNLLKPAHIDPDSGYRYYSFDQAYHVEIIMFCIELDIPLKELTQFTSADDMMNFRAFLTHGKEIAEQKLKKIRQGLALIRDLEQKMDLSEQYNPEEIYERDFPQKHFYIKPCGTSLRDLDLLELFVSFADIGDVDGSAEYGFLCEHSGDNTSYFAYMEVPKRMANKTIPAGKYACRQSEKAQIEQACELFKEHLTGSFLAIETEIFTGRHKINKPFNELRVITLDS